MSRLKIAVAGVGLIGRRHVELVRASNSCQLSAIVDPAPSGAELATRAGVPAYARLEDMLSASRPDGIILATPNRLHVEQALACIAAGVPALRSALVGAQHTVAQ